VSRKKKKTEGRERKLTMQMLGAEQRNPFGSSGAMKPPPVK
jgi:hypothetical protein